MFKGDDCIDKIQNHGSQATEYVNVRTYTILKIEYKIEYIINVSFWQ